MLIAESRILALLSLCFSVPADVEPNWHPSIWLGVLVVLCILVAERIYTTCKKFVAERAAARPGGAPPQGGQDGFQQIMHQDEPEDDVELGAVSGGALAAQYSITDDDSALMDDDNASPSAPAAAPATASRTFTGVGIVSAGSAAGKTIKIGGALAAGARK